MDLHRLPVLRPRPRRAGTLRVRLRLLGLSGRVQPQPAVHHRRPDGQGVRPGRRPHPVPAGRADPADPVRGQATPRPQRHPGPVASARRRDRDTSVRPDPVQAPLRELDVEGLHQRRTRAALRGGRAQHQSAALRAGPGQLPDDHRPARRHGRPVHHHPGLRRPHVHRRRSPRPAPDPGPDRRHPRRRGRPEQAPHPGRARRGPRAVRRHPRASPSPSSPPRSTR